ncbi:hypothetical protein BKA62DRAFT_87028 [Auriculariales sp. MPI-PUGE-AT-0066]|nr:hypothetical protein BKA62DRAFT_87028 [Auriculariales sp. MPI-PUGE-AT-0066]
MHTKRRSVLLLPLFAATALATSATQCRGSCKFEQRSVVGDQVPHSVHISGPSDLVADVSPASGWELLDCPDDWSKGAVDIRAVCTHLSPAESCDHLLEGGAENTVVRLPNECGTGSFARVARWEVAEDQHVPAGSVADNKLRRRNLKPQVFAARLDYNFRAIPSARGEVTFDVSAAHHSDVNDQIAHKNVARALRESSQRPALYVPTTTVFGDDGSPTAVYETNDLKFPGLPDIHLPTEFPSLPDIHLPTELPSLPDIHLPTDLPDIHLPTSLPSIPLPDLPDITIFKGGYEKSGGFEAIKFTGNHSLIDESLGCTFGKIGFDQSAKINVNSDILINAGYAFKIAGKLGTDSEITDFAIAGALSGRIDAIVDVDMYLSADILLPAVPILTAGIPGLVIPGILTLGPKATLNLQVDLAVDVSFSATLPLKFDFDKVDFVFPASLAPSGGDSTQTRKTSELQLSVSPGDQSGSIGLHVIPKIEFGLDVLDGKANAEVYAALDTDITFSSNGTIFPDFSYAGCQEITVGALAKAGVSAALFTFLHAGDFIPLLDKRHTLWSHCSKDTEGPTTAIYDNADGTNTFTNAGGDLVNQNGQLIDENNQVIADADAADAAPPPIKDESGNDIPEDDIVLDNGDGTYNDAQGNAVNADGQRISNNGTLLGCALDATQALLDASGLPIPFAEAIFDAGNGLFSNANCDIVNELGQLVDDDGNVIDYEPFTDENGAEIPASDVVIDNEDGTYSDPYGNSVDQWGGAMDFDDNGELISVELTPVEEDNGTQEEREPEVTDDPAFDVMSPDALKNLAVDLMHGTAPPAPLPTPEPPSSESSSTDSTSTDAPSSDSTSTDASSSETTSTDASSTDTASSDTTSTDASTTSTIDSTSTDGSTTTGSDTTSTDASSTDAASPSATPTDMPILIPNPIPVPSQAACKARTKRSISSDPARVLPTSVVSRTHARKRAMLGKRSGFGCNLPSIGGLPLMPALPGLDQLARVM